MNYTERPLEPPESKDKCYVFTCEASCKIEVGVWAENLEEAKERLENNDWDDTNILDDIKIEDVVDYKIED